MKTVSFPLRHKLIAALLDVNVKGVRRIVSRWLPRLLIPSPQGEVIIQTLYGFRLRIDPKRDEGVERSVYYTGTYEMGTLDLIGKILRPADTFLDAGANIGLMSVYAALKVGESGRVWAFEPNPTTTAMLRENLALNGLQNVEVMPFALGSAPGQATIYDRWDTGRGGATLIKPENVSTSAQVEVRTLDDCLPDGEVIRAAKFDIEGFELEALKGFEGMLKSKRAPILIIECSQERANYNSSSADLFTYITGINSYRVFKALRQKSRRSKLIEVRDSQNLPGHDNIYCFLDEHVQALKSQPLFA